MHTFCTLFDIKMRVNWEKRVKEFSVIEILGAFLSPPIPDSLSKFAYPALLNPAVWECACTLYAHFLDQRFRVVAELSPPMGRAKKTRGCRPLATASKSTAPDYRFSAGKSYRVLRSCNSPESREKIRAPRRTSSRGWQMTFNSKWFLSTRGLFQATGRYSDPAKRATSWWLILKRL
jgi:hypothetical protein